MNKNTFALIGPQGSGKGTQASMIAKQHGYGLITMGDVFREEFQLKSKRGLAFNEFLKKGELIPDKAAIEIFEEKYNAMNVAAGVVLDGFPRTVAQAIYLDGFLTVTAVIYFSLTRDVAIKRITGRRVCPQGHTFNLNYVKPKVEGACDIDGQPLSIRPDDSEDAVRTRLDLFLNVTTKVIDHYKTQDKLFEIDAAQSVADVSIVVEKVIGKYAR